MAKRFRVPPLDQPWLNKRLPGKQSARAALLAFLLPLAEQQGFWLDATGKPALKGWTLSKEDMLRIIDACYRVLVELADQEDLDPLESF